MTRRDELVATAARLADIGLAVGGGSALLLFGYLFYHYGLTGGLQFSNPLYLVLYYGCPLTAGVFLLATLRFRPTHRVNVSILFLTSFVSVYTLELFVELKRSSRDASSTEVMMLLQDSSHKARDAAELTKHWGVPIDTRSADEMIESLRKQFGDAVPSITTSNGLFVTQSDGSIKSAISMDGREVMPLAGVSSKMTGLCNENGEWISYQSDKHGFNNSDAIWQSTQLHIAAVGDSFTQGYCVPAERNFVALIRQHFPATLNLGIAGDGPLLTLATLSEYLPQFRPKIVLWFYFEGNDLIDLQRERLSALLKEYLNDNDFRQPALERQDDIDGALLRRIQELRGLSRASRARKAQQRIRNTVVPFAKLVTLRETFGLIDSVERNERDRQGTLLGPNMDTFRSTLARAKERVAGWGGELVFVYLPEWSRYSSRYGSPTSNRRADVLTVARALVIPIIDLCPAFEETHDPLSFFPFRRSGHYTEAGHRLVADEVVKALRHLRVE